MLGSIDRRAAAGPAAGSEAGPEAEEEEFANRHDGGEVWALMSGMDAGGGSGGGCAGWPAVVGRAVDGCCSRSIADGGDGDWGRRPRARDRQQEKEEIEE